MIMPRTGAHQQHISKAGSNGSGKEDVVETGNPFFRCTALPDHQRRNKQLPQPFEVVALTQVPDGTEVVVRAGNYNQPFAELRNSTTVFKNNRATFNDFRFQSRSGRGKKFHLSITIMTSPMQFASYDNAIKVTVDGARESRKNPSKRRLMSPSFPFQSSKRFCGRLNMNHDNPGPMSSSFTMPAHRLQFNRPSLQLPLSPPYPVPPMADPRFRAAALSFLMAQNAAGLFRPGGQGDLNLKLQQHMMLMGHHQRQQQPAALLDLVESRLPFPMGLSPSQFPTPMPHMWPTAEGSGFNPIALQQDIIRRCVSYQSVAPQASLAKSNSATEFSPNCRLLEGVLQTLIPPEDRQSKSSIDNDRRRCTKTMSLIDPDENPSSSSDKVVQTDQSATGKVGTTSQSQMPDSSSTALKSSVLAAMPINLSPDRRSASSSSTSYNGTESTSTVSRCSRNSESPSGSFAGSPDATNDATVAHHSHVVATQNEKFKAASSTNRRVVKFGVDDLLSKDG